MMGRSCQRGWCGGVPGGTFRVVVTAVSELDEIGKPAPLDVRVITDAENDTVTLEVTPMQGWIVIWENPTPSASG